MAKAKLTTKQSQFVKEYCIDFNATQAAIRVGYSKKTAYSQGQRLLKNVEVKKMLKQEAQRRESNSEIKSNDIFDLNVLMIKLDPLALFNPDGSPKNLNDIPANVRSLLIIESEVTADGYKVKYRMPDKQKASEFLGKALGMFNENINVNQTINNPFADLTTDELRRLASSE
jgi:phage terminase small subunit